MTTKGSSARGSAVLRAKELGAFSAACLTLAEVLPERVSLPQLTFFMLAATADLRGSPTTYSAIAEAMGDTAGRSIKSTYKIFLEPTRTFAGGLGWLQQEISSDDRRVKYLHITDKGFAVIAEVLDALKV